MLLRKIEQFPICKDLKPKKSCSCTEILVYLFQSIFLPVFLRIKTDNNERFEVFTAVTMKNAVFWDMKSQSVTHSKHSMSTLQYKDG
jgi:hypothetical protein